MLSDLSITFVSGLTGVGKSSTLATLKSANLNLLPNRRRLTDDIIIPQMQREMGQPVRHVPDRLERFELTRRYRETHGGMVTALLAYLQETNPDPGAAYVFDNLRGLTECTAGTKTFDSSRFIFLDAPPLTRLKRMLGRADRFDTINATRLENSSFSEQLLAIENLSEVFDAYELARLEANADIADHTILDAVRIIVKEHENYNAEAAASYLKTVLPPKRLLYLDTGQMPIDAVAAALKDWL